MNLLHEWPLVLFTLAVQAAVGLHFALLATGALHRTEDPAGHDGARGLRPSLLVGVLMAVAMASSFLHLGVPLNALRTLANLDQSWLSREILMALLFLGFWGVGHWFGRRPGPASWSSRALAWVTGLVGIGLIWVMARIYMVPARPLWDTWLTAAGFFMTTLLLGAAILAAYPEDRLVDPRNPGAVSLAKTALIPTGLAAVMAQFAVTLAHPLTGEVMAYPEGTPLVALRLLLLLSGALFLGIPLVRRPGPETTSPKVAQSAHWPAAALLLLGASEVVGRVLFYAVGTVNPF